VARVARDLRGTAADHRADGHAAALSLSCAVVGRLRLRLLVEPDRRRGGDPFEPPEPAGGRARRGGGDRGAARSREGAARQCRRLVRKPDGARGDERRQLRHHFRRRPWAALQRAAQRAGFGCLAARRRWPFLARAGAGRARAAAAERRQPRRLDHRGAAAAVRGASRGRARPRAQHRRAQQRARRLDRRRSARAPMRYRSSPARRVSPATTRPWRNGCARRRIRPRSRPSRGCARRPSAKGRPASPMRSRIFGAMSAPTPRAS